METLFDTNSNNEITSQGIEALVGEGKKYKDVNELAKAYQHLQAHTQIIQNENREYRTQENDLLQKTKTLEENMKKIMEKLSTQSTNQNVNSPLEGKPVNTFAQETPVPVKQNVLGPSDLKQIVQDVLKEETSQTQRKANLDIVNNEAIRIFGSLEKANEFVKQKAADSGLSLNDFAEVAMKSPKAFFEMAGIKRDDTQGKPKVATTQNEVNSKAFFGDKPVIEDETKWEFYSNLRRTNPQKYYSGEVQSKLHKLVAEGVVVLPSSR